MRPGDAALSHTSRPRPPRGLEGMRRAPHLRLFSPVPNRSRCTLPPEAAAARKRRNRVFFNPLNPERTQIRQENASEPREALSKVETSGCVPLLRPTPHLHQAVAVALPFMMTWVEMPHTSRQFYISRYFQTGLHVAHCIRFLGLLYQPLQVRLNHRKASPHSSRGPKSKMPAWVGRCSLRRLFFASYTSGAATNLDIPLPMATSPRLRLCPTRPPPLSVCAQASLL